MPALIKLFGSIEFRCPAVTDYLDGAITSGGVCFLGVSSFHEGPLLKDKVYLIVGRSRVISNTGQRTCKRSMFGY